ncbi:tetratricopeptide repeat-containing sulfotransferase family protein [Pseudoalteromonas undina]|uniref:Sulfotransferase n=1 Tax=Pseudoalteromonas undina TaxID=43660 RepID=A0ACC6R0J1_9GAMM
MDKFSLTQALNELNNGEISKGKAILNALTADPTTAEQALILLFKVSMREKNSNEAKLINERLVSIAPSKFDYVNTLVHLYLSSGDTETAISKLTAFISQNPKHAHAHFLLGSLARKLGNGLLAKQHLLSAQENQFPDIYLVKLEIALVYSDLLNDHQSAIYCLEEAIKIRKNNVNAYFNLANIYEQMGNKSKSLELFQQVLVINPKHGLAHARLADIATFTPASALEYEQESLEIIKQEKDNSIVADLYYALGKIFNDIADYKKAWEYYFSANRVNRSYIPKYNKNEVEKLTKLTLERREKPVTSSENSELTPIIICGMFRSGSTLIEQILAASDYISAGGEIDYIHKTLFNLIANPIELENTANTREFKDGYKRELALRANNREFVTDKRPENYLYIDQIKSIYPNAKIIWTERDIRDNSLSAYFQHLGPSLNYATNLSDTLHYYTAQQKVKSHWLKKYTNDIFTVNYDELVLNPEKALKPLFYFLGIEYKDESSIFHEKRNIVSTASVWQVRKPLYTSSSGRYKNFSQYIEQSISSEEFDEFSNFTR